MVNTLQKKVKRLERKLEIQKNLLDILQQENQLQSAKLGSIDGCLSELVENQAKNVCRKTKKVYTDNIKEFAMTMHYYSPKAYGYLRSKLELPTSRTIQRWLESVECEPGFLTDILKLVNERNGENIYSLVFDSMSIRKRLNVNKANSKVEGHVTIGDSSKLASQALVFLLVPILGGTRFPVGFFFVDKIDSDMQTQLIKQCLTLTAEEKITIVNVTCDGCQSNLSTLKKLGAITPSVISFKHPSMEHDVFVTLDPVHMLKLGRNAFGTYCRFKSAAGTIDYKYNVQESTGVRLANKLTKRHLNWKNMKMKVKLAAQLLSSSVADALTYLKNTDDSFTNATSTIEFIREVREICIDASPIPVSTKLMIA